jgi:hypothetical protein
MKHISSTETALAATQTKPNRKAPLTSGVPPARLIQVVLWGVLLTIGIWLMLNQVLEASRVITDICQDYIAVKRVFAGQNPYLPLQCWSKSGVIHIPTPAEFDAHPPSSIVFFLPLGFFTASFASMIWGMVSLFAYLLSGFLLLREVGWRSVRSLTLFVLASLFWSAFAHAEQIQNLAQVLLLLLVGSWVLERRGKTSLAGILIGVAGLLKFWPALFLLLAILRGRFRVAITGGITVAVGTLISVGILGTDAITAYLGPVQHAELLWVPFNSNLSVPGLISRSLLSGGVPIIGTDFSTIDAARIGEVVGMLFLGGMSGLVWWCYRHCPNQVGELLTQSILLTLLLVLFPLTWPWVFIMLLWPAALLILALRLLPSPPFWWWLIVVVSLIPLLIPTWELPIFEQKLTGWETLLFGVMTFADLLFALAQFLLLVMHLRAGRRQEAPLLSP